MTMTDPISDMLARIRNACQATHEELLIPASRIKENIARILLEEGFIDSYERVEQNGHTELKLRLRYSDDREPAIAGLRRISKPGRRVYRGASELPRVLGGLGIAIISTSQGVMTDKEARRSKVGGEVLAYIW
jgi:small subunit ribosomal protein S8